MWIFGFLMFAAGFGLFVFLLKEVMFGGGWTGIKEVEQPTPKDKKRS